ncbi:MAG: DUF3592 domain-containing protein [Pseudomonadota bacterium]|nr:DUF3592 domain-containing protein [Pseudomonadota bacterium]
MKGKITALVMAGLGLICAIGSAWFIVSDRQQIAEARSWPSTPAQIIGSWLDVDRTSGRNRRTRYIPRINYSYTVGGQTYRNDYIWLTSTQSYSTRNTAETFLRDYQPGATIPVYYSPADPQRSALLIESGAGPMYILLGVGLFLIGLGIWLYRRAARTPARAG